MSTRLNKIHLSLLAILFVVGLLSASFVNAVSAQQAKPILIGVPTPRGNIWGRIAEQGLILTAEEINAAGGINVGGVKRPIKLEIVDTRDLDPGVPVGDVLLSIEKLILGKKVDIMCGGPNMSEAGLAAMDLYAKHKILGITAFGVWTPAWRAKAAKDIKRYKYCFKVSGDAAYWGVGTENMLRAIKKDYGLNKIYFISGEAAHARAFCEGIRKAADADGWQVLGFDVNPIATTDYSIPLSNAATKGAQVIITHQQPPFDVHLIKQWADMKVPALLFGFLSSVSDPAMWNATSGKVNYVVLVEGEAGCSPDVNITPFTKPYFDSYVRRWGEEPYIPPAFTCRDSLYALKDAIERAGTLNTDGLITALEQTDMVSAGGRLRFDKTNHNAIYGEDPKEVRVGSFLQWQDGKRVVVHPPAIAVGKIKLPPGVK